jgi:hypothetical protein
VTRRGGLPAQLNEFWAARGREAGETAADRVLVACREITDDGKAIALLDAHRKRIALAESVLRHQAVAEADIAAFGRAWVGTFDAETAPLRILAMLSKAGIIRL